MSVTTASIKRKKLTGDLRALAHFIEHSPEVPVPTSPSINVHVSAEEFIAAARVLDGDIDVVGKFALCRRAFGTIVLSIQTYKHELLGEDPKPDVAERVQALLDGAVAA